MGEWTEDVAAGSAYNSCAGHDRMTELLRIVTGIGMLIKYEKNFRTLIEELTANYERNKEFDT